MKTYATKISDIKSQWYEIDATGLVLGRLSSRVAHMLKGKHKPIYAPYIDTGDHIIVVNADKVVITGKKLDQSIHYRHTGYPGGLKAATTRQIMQTKPEKVIRLAVHGMLPKGIIGKQMIKKLKVYAGAEHPHEAQQPRKISINQMGK